MIRTLSLTNFKGFQSLNQLDIKPVTVLCGTNSSGKSSILQSILLLKQTLESQMPNQLLLLNGRLVHLGPFEEVIFDRETDRRLGFDLNLFVTSDSQRSLWSNERIPVQFLIRELSQLAGRNVSEREPLNLRFRVEIKSSRQSTAEAQLKPLQVEVIEISIKPDAKSEKEESSYLLVHESDDRYRLTFKNIQFRGKVMNEELIVRLAFSNLGSARILMEEGEKTHRFELLQPLYLMEELLKSSFASYTYIGPLREQPLRRYIYDDEVIEIGTKGENAPYIYLAEQGKWVSDLCFYDERTDSFEKHATITLERAVRTWLDQMGIKGFSSQLSRDIIYVHLDSGPGRKQKVSIADVGFGVSQIFPIILEGLRMPPQATLLLEQPEIHLHPNIQMRLADYFVALAMSNKNVIVETHSDHIVNRLVRRILEDTTGKLAEAIGIYFVSNSQDGSKFQPINIDPLEGIVNWPEGFFDQNAAEQELIIRTCLNNRSRQTTR
jgi:predicted ATPase